MASQGSGASSVASRSQSSASRPDTTLKVTMPFMKAYKAMRGPGDVEPSPLFVCLAPRNGSYEDGDVFRLAERDEAKMLSDIDDMLLVDGDPDGRPPLVVDNDDDDNDGRVRQLVFHFQRPHTTDVLYSETSNQASSGQCSCHRARPIMTSTMKTTMADHALDHEKLDLGWTAANGPGYSDGDESFVSDDDGHPAESRISPAEFRSLVVGCRRNDVDDLRIPIVSTSSARPLTPQDKIIDFAHEAGRVDARVFGGRRQFDCDDDDEDGDELSPAYRVDSGPARSVLWSPAGVTPERAGLFLSLPGGGLLYRRMAPQPCQELRTRLFGEEDGGSSSGSSSSIGSAGTGSRRPALLTTFTWSEVDEAVAAHARDGSRPLAGVRSDAIVSASDVRSALRKGWCTLRACEAEEAELEAANTLAEAAATAQARRLARLERQLEQRLEQRAEQQKRQREAQRQQLRRQRRIVRDVALQLRDLQAAVQAAEARLARGRELQVVLARRLRSGEARIRGVGMRARKMMEEEEEEEEEEEKK